MSAENIYEDWTWDKRQKVWVSPYSENIVTKVAFGITGRKVRGKFWMHHGSPLAALNGPFDSWEEAVWAAEKHAA